ncbi:MAG: DUF975 family protein [Clostridiales bacterium]|jgi:uncharacterized membrane protein|nr:DUF975 family protein [Clostridiales bacterium]
MPYRADLKHRAKEQIRGNIAILFIMMLLIGLMTGASAFTVVGPVILAGAFMISNAGIYLSLSRGKRPELGDLFNGFYILGRAVGLYLMMSVFAFLWSLLFYIPGIIKMLSYSMAPYILAENPRMTSSEALNESKRMMRGHCGELFILQLSFLPWALLTAVTAGIAGIYVIPYMSATMANYYNALRYGSGPAAPATAYDNHYKEDQREGRLQ